MNSTIELNQGEVKVVINEFAKETHTFQELGLKAENLSFENGMMRLVFEFENFKSDEIFHTPTIEFTFNEELTATHWQCDFNNETIFDKINQRGHNTLILLNRSAFQKFENRHQNQLVIHAEFPVPVTINPEKSVLHF